MPVRDFDRDVLRQQCQTARPFPFFKIDNFLDPSFAHEVTRAYPSFEHATSQGRTFTSVNERRKVQVTDARLFPEPVARLNAALAAPKFLEDLAYITGIPRLLFDTELAGGGIHITGPGGRLDVHVDFNYLKERNLHRRLNLLLYLNPVWEEEWGGHIQLWNKNVTECQAAFAPAFNRCVVFETSNISFHGVTPISPAAPYPRKSFATYYYTREAPVHWTGVAHDTIFKARPEERLRGYVLMPAEAVTRQVSQRLRQVRKSMKRLMGASN